MSRNSNANLDFECEMELFADGMECEGPKMAVRINYDYEGPYAGSRDDPPYGAGCTANSVQLLIDGEPVDCPKWLEAKIFAGIDEGVLLEHAAEQLEEAF